MRHCGDRACSWDKGLYRQAAALEALGRNEEALAAAQASVRCAGSADAGTAEQLARRLIQQTVRTSSDAAAAQPGSSGMEAAAAREAFAQAAQGGSSLRGSIPSGTAMC